MGYESKIFIVRKSNLAPDTFGSAKGLTFAMKIAEINLGKVGGMPKCFYLEPVDGSEKDKKPRVTKHFIYDSDGDTPLIKDKYGDNLAECTPKELLKWVTRAIEHGDFWGELHLLKAMLTEIVEDQEDIGCWNSVICLHYGY